MIRASDPVSYLLLSSIETFCRFLSEPGMSYLWELGIKYALVYMT